MRHWAKHIRPIGAVALLGATVLVAASCDVSARPPAARAGALPDSGAPPDTARPAVAGAVSDRSTSGPADSAAREVGEIAAGTNLALASAVQLCTGISRAGDAFTATVTGSVMGSRGAVIPVGSIVLGRVIASRDSLVLAFDSVAIAGAARIASYPLAARMIGPPQRIVMEPPPPNPSPGMNYTRVRTYCIPEHGRITIQLTADVPVGR
jgi:hypothetical protein